ncbi:hypothetical protein GQ457_06G041760 [Hibiscus cannabinus]
MQAAMRFFFNRFSYFIFAYQAYADGDSPIHFLKSAVWFFQSAIFFGFVYMFYTFVHPVAAVFMFAIAVHASYFVYVLLNIVPHGHLQAPETPSTAKFTDVEECRHCVAEEHEGSGQGGWSSKVMNLRRMLT